MFLNALILFIYLTTMIATSPDRLDSLIQIMLVGSVALLASLTLKEFTKLNIKTKRHDVILKQHDSIIGLFIGVNTSTTEILKIIKNMHCTSGHAKEGEEYVLDILIKAHEAADARIAESYDKQQADKAIPE